MRPYAICSNGHVFRSGFNIEGGEINLSGCQSSCPECGQLGDIPDGMYSVIDGVLKYVKTSGFTRTDINDLVAILSESREQGLSVEDIKTKLTQKSERFANLGEFIPKSVTLEFLSLLVGVLALLYDISSQNASVTNNYYTVNNITQQTVVQSSSVLEPKRSLPKKVNKKLSAHDPCHCGKLKKYQDCCMAIDTMESRIKRGQAIYDSTWRTPPKPDSTSMQ